MAFSIASMCFFQNENKSISRGENHYQSKHEGICQGCHNFKSLKKIWGFWREIWGFSPESHPQAPPMLGGMSLSGCYELSWGSVYCRNPQEREMMEWWMEWNAFWCNACCELRKAQDVIQRSAVQQIFFSFTILTTFVGLCVATRLALLNSNTQLNSFPISSCLCC